MNSVVADTVTIIWWLSGDERLSAVAGRALQDADDGDGIYVSAITDDQLAALDVVLGDPQVNIRVLPVTEDVARLARYPSREALPDPFDRVILATARANEMPLISPDRMLRQLPVGPAVW